MMAEILAWSAQEEDLRADISVTEYSGDGDDTVNLKLHELYGTTIDTEVTPKFARELARDLNAAARRCETKKAKR